MNAMLIIVCTLWWHETTIIHRADNIPYLHQGCRSAYLSLNCSLHQTARLREKPFPLWVWAQILWLICLFDVLISALQPHIRCFWTSQFILWFGPFHGFMTLAKPFKIFFFVCVWQKLRLSPVISETARGAWGHNQSFLTSPKLWFREQEAWIMNEMFAGSHFT